MLITADGPKGPARRVKAGTVQLAAKTGAWVIPISWSGSRVKVLEKSWDRFLVPLPFGRIRFAYGQPLRIEPGLEPAACERGHGRTAAAQARSPAAGQVRVPRPDVAAVTLVARRFFAMMGIARSNMKKIRKLGILTGGGDCPGLNAVIRAVVHTACREYGLEVCGIIDGYAGLIHKNVRQLELADVSGILPRGGTILGTSNRDNPFHYADEAPGGKKEYRDVSAQALKTIEYNEIDVLIAVGGDGTQSIANQLLRDARPARHRRAQDHRQRPERHRRHLRLRHGPEHRHHGHRQAAFDGRGPSPRDGHRGDGPLRRLDRSRSRAWPAAATSSSIPEIPYQHRQGLRQNPRPRRTTASASPWSWSPKGPSPKAANWSSPARSTTPATRSAWAASPPRSPTRSRT